MELELVVEKDCCVIKGSFTRDYINVIMPAGESFIGSSINPVFDLREATEVDSAGIALLVYYLGVASNKNKKVNFSNISQATRSIIELSGLEELFS